MDNANDPAPQPPPQEPSPQAWEQAAMLRNTPLRVITKFLPGTFYVIDRDGRFVLWNSNLEQVTELTPAQLRSAYAPALFVESDRATIEQRMRPVLEDNEEVVLEPSCSVPAARSAATCCRARIECNNNAYLCGIGLDQTERRQQEGLPRLRERALHAASNGIVITRCAGKENPIEYVNPAFERITGYSAAESLGRDSRFMAAPGLDDDKRTQLRWPRCAGWPTAGFT